MSSFYKPYRVFQLKVDKILIIVCFFSGQESDGRKKRDEVEDDVGTRYRIYIYKNFLSVTTKV